MIRLVPGVTLTLRKSFGECLEPKILHLFLDSPCRFSFCFFFFSREKKKKRNKAQKGKDG